MVSLVDTHCHLQDERLAADLDACLAQARAAGVNRFVCCGSAPSDWAAVDALARQHPEIHPSFGLHPWYAGEAGSEWPADLEARLQEWPVAALGEVGLDGAVAVPMAAQRSAFAAQLALAARRDRPLSIHCRKAWQPLLACLRETPPPRGFAMHSFSGPREVVAPLLALGAYFSFSGAITRPNYRRGLDVIPRIPADRLLLETDAPDLPATPRDGPPPPRGEPAQLVRVCERLAEICGMAPEELAARTTRNAARLFGWPAS